MDPKWKIYQEDVAQFFRELGLNAETDVTINGSRSNHDIDILVESIYKGISTKWIIECKRWKRRVPKLHVQALRSIVDDVGADRGLLMSEVGYQKGAREAAYLTNIQLTSLANLRETCKHDLAMMRVRKLYLHAIECGARYWDLSKDTRIKYKLRGDMFEVYAYNGEHVVKGIERALLAAMFHGFPVLYNETLAVLGPYMRPQTRDGDVTFETPSELADYVGEKLDELERLLRQAEADPIS